MCVNERQNPWYWSYGKASMYYVVTKGTYTLYEYLYAESFFYVGVIKSGQKRRFIPLTAIFVEISVYAGKI
jgi:hypothetical protein